jgi:hypothetical protein
LQGSFLKRGHLKNKKRFEQLILKWILFKGVAVDSGGLNSLKNVSSRGTEASSQGISY